MSEMIEIHLVFRQLHDNSMRWHNQGDFDLVMTYEMTAVHWSHSLTYVEHWCGSLMSILRCRSAG
jgi:hypothetical protein